MRVNAIRIPCFDIDRSAAFYTKLLGRKKAFGSVAEGYVGFALDNVTLLIEPEEATEFEVGRYLGFSLEVPNVAEFYRSLKDSIQFSA